MTIKLVKKNIKLGVDFMDNFMENNVSRKEELLAKSRQVGKDEGVEHAEVQGFKLGERIGSVAAMVVIVLAFFIGQAETIFAVGTIIFATVFGQSLTVYRFKKTKYYSAWVVLGIVGTVYFFMLFIAATQEWTAFLEILWRY